MGRGSFNQDNVSKLVAQARPAPGYGPLLITEAEQHTPANDDPNKEPNHNLMWALTYRMLEDPEDTDSVQGPAIREWLTLPLENNEVEGHEPPSYATDQACEMMAAIFPEDCVDVPRLQGEKRKKKLYYRDEEIPRSAEKSCRREALTICGPKIEETDDDLSQLVGHVIYADLYYPKKNPEFPRLARKSSEADPNKEMRTEFTEYAEDNDSDSGTKRGKTARKKTQRKKAAAKKGGRRRK